MMQYPSHWFALDTNVNKIDAAAATAEAGINYTPVACRPMRFKRQRPTPGGPVQPDDVVFAAMNSAIEAAEDKLLLVHKQSTMGVLMLKHDGLWSQYRPANRPRRDPTAARISRGMRCHPDTWARIDAEAKRTEKSAGEVIDRLADTLPL